MGFRFRKSFKILPGVRINFSKTGISTSIGGRGATLNFRNGKVKGTVGLPGTGLSYSTYLSKNEKGRQSEPVQISMTQFFWFWVIAIALFIRYAFDWTHALIFVAICSAIFISRKIYIRRKQKRKELQYQAMLLETLTEPKAEDIIEKKEERPLPPPPEREPIIKPLKLDWSIHNIEFNTEKVEYDKNVSLMSYLSKKCTNNAEMNSILYSIYPFQSAIDYFGKYAPQTVVIMAIIGEEPFKIARYSMVYFMAILCDLFNFKNTTLMTSMDADNIDYIESVIDVDVIDCFIYIQGTSGMGVVQFVDYALNSLMEDPDDLTKRCYKKIGVGQLESLIYNFIEIIYKKHKFSIKQILISNE